MSILDNLKQEGLKVLQEEQDNDSSFHIKQAITALIKNAQVDYVVQKQDNHKSLEGYHSISQISGDSCLRKAFYKALNYPLNEHTQENIEKGIKSKAEKDWIFSFGHFIHDKIQNLLKNDLKKVEMFMKDSQNLICGSTDGTLSLPKGRVVLDFKSCNLNIFDYVTKRQSALKNHIAQAHNYARILNIAESKKKQPNLFTHIAIVYFNKNQALFNNTDFATMKKMVKDFRNDLEYNLLSNIPPENVGQILNTKQLINNIIGKYESELEKKQSKATTNNLRDFYSNFLFIYVQPIDQILMETELEKIKDLNSNIEFAKKENKRLVELEQLESETGEQLPKNHILKQKIKYKIPNKISKIYICESCDYYETCRINKLK